MEAVANGPVLDHNTFRGELAQLVNEERKHKGVPHVAEHIESALTADRFGGLLGAINGRYIAVFDKRHIN